MRFIQADDGYPGDANGAVDGPGAAPRMEVGESEQLTEYPAPEAIKQEDERERRPDAPEPVVSNGGTDE